jgi:hypothetical protein
MKFTPELLKNQNVLIDIKKKEVNIMKIAARLTSLVLLITLLMSLIPAAADELLIMPISAQQLEPFYCSYTGTVKEIEIRDNNTTSVYLTGENGSEAYFILSKDTYYIDSIKIEKGMEITGYYEAGRPMIMIYPPQYSIDIVAPVTENGFVKADKFDSELLSKDKTLKLNISENTEILWREGTQMYWFKAPTVSELETALSNRRLIVYYDFTTKSIPAQTTPTKIIVLSQQEFDVLEVIVNGNIIEAPQPYINENELVMVPVRAISEALGYEVKWNNDERIVQIGNDITLRIGDNSCSVSGKEPVTLETAPLIKGDRTFVALSFFNEVLSAAADFTDNKVMISR